MGKKLNKILRKKYTEKKFRKKILSRLFLEDEKKSVLDFYRLEEGFYLPSETDDRKKIKELNRIAKTIKNNSGALGIGKTGALAAVVILAILFSLFLKNPLAEKGLEKALEAAFKAESEIDSLSLSLLKGDISFKALRVTDRETPDKNLFETGRAEINIRMKEALKGKFNAEKIELEYFAIDTDRKNRGKVFDKEEQKASEKKSRLPSFKAPEITEDSVKKLIEENLNSLSTPSELAKIRESYEDTKNEIKTGLNSTENQLESLEKTADEVKKTKINSPLEVDKIKKLTNDINSAIKTADSILEEIEETGDKFKSAQKLAVSGKSIIGTAAEKDFAFLSEKLNPAQSFDLKEYMRNYIMESFAPFLKKYEKAFSIAEKLKKEKGKKAETVKVKRGRNIYFPVTNNKPRFLIEKTSGSFVDGKREYSMMIDSITNNQDLAGKPTEFTLAYSKNNENISIEGYFDNREAREKNSSVKLNLPGADFKFSNFLPGVNTIEGVYNLTSEISIEKDRSLSGLAEIKTSSYEAEGTDDFTGKAVSSVLNKNTPLEFSLSFKTGKDTRKIKLDSNLDRLLKDTLSPSELTSDQKDMIMEGLESYFKDSIDENSRIGDEINSMRGELDSLKSRLEREKASLKKKLDSAVPADKVKIPGADKVKLPTKLW